jgi:5-oxoprolinase (ATP-hydrolysing)
MSKSNRKWRFSVDRGGTFTDIVGLDPTGIFHTMKLLSSSDDYEDASIEGIRRIIGLRRGERLPEDGIEGIRLGTTVATNALLERKGGKVVLFITKGFSDLLEIGYQNRPDIFRLCIKKFPPVYSTVIEVDERMDSKGRVVKELDVQGLSLEIKKLEKRNIDSVAVVLLHSWINPDHEKLCETVLNEHGFSNIFLSHKTVNLIKVISRGQSTLVNAYLNPVVAQYMDGIKKDAGGIKIEFMQSNGTLSAPLSFTGKNALLSGPAGGAISVAEIAEEKGIKGVIGFDMGGTSTDVSRYDGEFKKRHEHVIGGIPLQIEMLDINTVAAGGGSILSFDGRKMTAGPESAGSYPGPACYGFDGPLTVTDANLITGRLAPQYFPKTFGPERNSSLNTDVVEEKFSLFTQEINSATGNPLSRQDTAIGFLRIANEKMAMAIKEISISRGFDVREYALVCFGGAGGQHACSIASLLDIDTIIIHPLSGVMSAYGIGLSKPAWKAEQTIMKTYNIEAHKELSYLFERMEEDVLVEKKGTDYKIRREIDLRPKGAETFMTLEYDNFKKTVRNFKEQYEKLFGFSTADLTLEVVNLRVEIRETSEFLIPYKEENKQTGTMPAPASYQNVYYAGGCMKTPLYMRENLPQLKKVKGPAIIIDSQFTVVVDPGFEAVIDTAGVIILTRIAKTHEIVSDSSGKPDPVLLEVFNNIFMGIATEMGLTLKSTAYSVNMKERLDFSCAIFDSYGNLAANAPHIPVHLGAMADTVKAILEDNRNTMRPGDIYLTNNPYRGGSHLSDMTVVCPVFSSSGELIFFTAARGHHSDVGGTTPGSMPPSACHIDEEGVLVDNFLLVRNGTFRESKIREILLSHRYPARNIPERISDFSAQIAACNKGMKELRQITARYGLDTVMHYMRFIQENSEYSVKKALHQFLKHSDTFCSIFEDYLDDGTSIKAAVMINGGCDPPETLKAVIDFSGTGKQHLTDNLNAPFSVTRSAVLYVLRTLIDRDIPLNSGCLKPVDIIIPKDTVLNPVYPAPVATGNVETSQRIVDVLLGVFGIAAASQGTMNNLLFEVEGESPYYETIAGGSGAIDGCPGASGVQVHMTNTRMTDPEILEFRHHGVRLEQFCLRKSSGGRGMYPGGSGVIREIKFLKPATVSILSERRAYAPYGAKDGEAGKKGVNLLKKAAGKTEELRSREVLKVNKNDSIVIETPGGGGYGKAE